MAYFKQKKSLNVDKICVKCSHLTLVTYKYIFITYYILPEVNSDLCEQADPVEQNGMLSRCPVGIGCT